MNRAYVWTRELSPQRLRLIDDLQSTWEDLFGERGNRGHFAGLQWAAPQRRARHIVKPFPGIVDGRSVEVHLGIVSARTWYARELYLRALAKTRARYPDFDAHRFVGGDRIGERRLEFLNERHALTRCHLEMALRVTAETDNPVVHEACLLESCGTTGHPVALLRAYEAAPHPDHIRATLIRDVADPVHDDAAGAIADLQAGRRPVFSPEPIVFSFNDITDGLVELSNPELVLLNWADALNAWTDAEDALWKAADDVDGSGVERALAHGANVNAMGFDRQPILSALIDGWRYHQFRCRASDLELEREGWGRPSREASHEEMLTLMRRLLDAGAHPDLHQPGQIPALTAAVLVHDRAIVRLLLDHGADSSIVADWTDGPSEWPAAWYYADGDGFMLEEAGAREAYYEMITRYSSPCFEQADEDDDRRDAVLPPPERKWQPRYPGGRSE